MVDSLQRRVPASRRATDRRGFTLVELMITLTVLAAVMVVLMTVMYAAQQSKTSTSNRVESTQGARIAVDMMARDLRSAGYGADLDWIAAPQPAVAYIDSLQVLINANMRPWPDGQPYVLPGPGQPQAYEPTGSPKPFPLNGTIWQPPMKYRGGAEVVRWTLDANNDGKVDSLDWTVPDGLDAQRTPNRSDYVLVRQVYGDSTGLVAGNNGGTTERIALVQRPARAGVPPLFKVYLEGSSTPWDWSSGPVPPSQLGKIERIVVSVSAGSARPDPKGNYATTVLSTEINSMRNVPNFGATQYAVDGYVFNDLNKNGAQDPGDLGLNAATVRLGIYSTLTNASGYFLFKVPAGTYTLRHVAPPGFGVLNSPDSFVVTVGPATTRSFADTASAGGWVTSFTYEDVNANGAYNAGTDSILRVVKVTVNPGNDIQYTDNGGVAVNFAPAGAYTVTATAPDSFIATTTNPESGVMVNGGAASYSFGFTRAGVGTFAGKVYVDNNRNGVLDAGEPGIQNVWVGVTPDAGITIAGWQYSDASGNFSIQVPERNPPSTPYYVTSIVKAGYFPTSTTAIGPYYLNTGQTIGNCNFGEVGYQVITLNASRVLSLASRDLIEADWNGNQTQNARADHDLVLGADASGSDQISVWFNQYDNSPLFDPNPSYTRAAQGSVLSIAVDTLDNTASWRSRPDLATGTKNASGGNFFVWLNQNSNNNEAILLANASLSYRTADMGDVQAILAYDCAGGSMPDLIVGTKSPTANQGSIEVWMNNDAASPTFTREEIYPPAGAIPSASLGEITAMALADFDGDGFNDLVVGTRNDTYGGQLFFFKFVSKLNGARFVYQCGYKLDKDAVTSIACFDISGDGLPDVIVGTQSSLTQGHLQQWNNKLSFPTWDFQLEREVVAPGIVLSLAAADFGSTARTDLAVGFRADAASYVGGLRVYFCDTDKVPAFGGDPSAGSVTYMVPALATGNFNYGVKPAQPTPPYLTDLSAGVKITASTGALVVYIR
jgi:prepilin-type N-terminal cleavage/methylation domain-containing protein